MAIEGVTSIQAAGYQINQPAPKQVEAVSIDPAVSAVSTDMAAKVSTVKTADNADSNSGYDNQKRDEAMQEQVKKAVSDMNKRMQNAACQFGIHEGTGRVTIKLVGCGRYEFPTHSFKLPFFFNIFLKFGILFP